MFVGGVRRANGPNLVVVVAVAAVAAAVGNGRGEREVEEKSLAGLVCDAALLLPPVQACCIAAAIGRPLPRVATAIWRMLHGAEKAMMAVLRCGCGQGRQRE